MQYGQWYKFDPTGLKWIVIIPVIIYLVVWAIGLTLLRLVG